MKFKLFLLFLYLTTFSAFSQVENKPKTTAIPAVENKEEKKEPTTTPVLIKPVENPSLTKINKNMSGITVKSPATIRKSEEEFSMIDNSTLIDPGTIYAKKWKEEKRKKEIEERNIPAELMVDQFLGDFKIKGDYVNVICRDFGEEDGDLIEVIVNDEIFISRLELTNGYKTFRIPLMDGINKIDFYAINEGTVGLNTAEFQLYDENDNFIVSKNWHLPTDVEAKLILIKE